MNLATFSLADNFEKFTLLPAEIRLLSKGLSYSQEESLRSVSLEDSSSYFGSGVVPFMTLPISDNSGKSLQHLLLVDF